jgi:hypothetical protein
VPFGTVGLAESIETGFSARRFRSVTGRYAMRGVLRSFDLFSPQRLSRLRRLCRTMVMYRGHRHGASASRETTRRARARSAAESAPPTDAPIAAIDSRRNVADFAGGPSCGSMNGNNAPMPARRVGIRTRALDFRE